MFRQTLAALVSLPLLAGCASDPTGTNAAQLFTAFFTDDVPVISGALGDDEGVEQPQLTRAAIAGIDLPLMLATVPKTRKQAALGAVAVKGRIVTWQQGEQVTLTFDGPVLFGVRGIGADLLTAETAELADMLLADKAGDLTRTLRYLDGLDQIQKQVFTCTVARAGAERIVILEVAQDTRKSVENCTGPNGLKVQNVYWIGSDGTLWQSRQWMNVTQAYIETQRLVR